MFYFHAAGFGSRLLFVCFDSLIHLYQPVLAYRLRGNELKGRKFYIAFDVRIFQAVSRLRDGAL